MDRTVVSGTIDGGSIPSRAATNAVKRGLWEKWKHIHEQVTDLRAAGGTIENIPGNLKYELRSTKYEVGVLHDAASRRRGCLAHGSAGWGGSFQRVRVPAAAVRVGVQCLYPGRVCCVRVWQGLV